MVKLFNYSGYSVSVDPEALMLAPFKAVWDKDKSKDKSLAQQELAFIYFVGDPRSDYQYIMDEETRIKEVQRGIGLPSKWKPDKIVKDALKFYQSFKPVSAGLLEDTRVAVNKLRQLLRDIDLNAQDDKGKPIYTLNTITATIKQIPGLVKDLDQAEKMLSKDLIAEAKARGSQVKGAFEDED